ncbi:MFS transporter permease [Persicimonas caeni]|uniref:MFS transporter permease n=1 Tax=Persicimonas caeni TaxID=2292766 RepID=A0A4Y6PQA9_PERCE|nr:DUF6064 family protein [Persicimonas caeni]QDG50531.1 MFS transporter permease [Persicimonas caeni]QED31752.1 MFS transporter permease [Persicimonas caeni]
MTAMGDLSTYSLEDFFPFLPEVYFRLFVRLNEGWWPAHLVALLLGAAALWLAWRGFGRLVGAALAICWTFVGYAFFLELYANLNWAGTYFGWAFIAQSALLLIIGALGGLDRELGRAPDRTQNRPLDPAGWVGVGLVVFALAIFPLLEPLTGVQDWKGAELFGIAPDPTVIATLGFVLMARRPRWLLLIVPVLWCAISGATAWVMEAPVGLVTPACALIALGAAVRKTFASDEHGL